MRDLARLDFGGAFMVSTSTGKLLTTAEAADILGVSEATLHSWRYRRIGPPYLKLAHKTVRYSRPELESWLRRQRVER